MANDPHYQEPQRLNRPQVLNQYEEIGEVNFGVIQLKTPKNQAKSKKFENLNNRNILAENTLSTTRRGSYTSRINGSCWFTVLTIVFMIISSTSLALNVLIINGIIVTPGCSEQG